MTVRVIFLVFYVSSPNNAILVKRWIHQIKTISLIYHQKILFLIRYRVYGDVMPFDWNKEILLWSFDMGF